MVIARGTGPTAAVDGALRQRLRQVDYPRGGIEIHILEVLGQRRIHGLGMVGEPGHQLGRHAADHMQLPLCTAFRPLAHDLQHDAVLQAVAVVRRKAVLTIQRSSWPKWPSVCSTSARQAAGSSIGLLPPRPAGQRTPGACRPSPPYPAPVRRSIPVWPCACSANCNAGQLTATQWPCRLSHIKDSLSGAAAGRSRCAPRHTPQAV
jgi:hypothetical protein